MHLRFTGKGGEWDGEDRRGDWRHFLLHTHTHDLLSLTIYTRFRLPHLVYRLTSCRYIVLTTSLGIMDHEEMRRKSTGGKILGFFY